MSVISSTGDVFPRLDTFHSDALCKMTNKQKWSPCGVIGCSDHEGVCEASEEN